MRTTTDQEKRIQIIARIQKSLSHGLSSFKSVAPQNWLKERGLSVETCGAGFNSGQMQHRKTKEFLDNLVIVGFLKPNYILSKNGDTGFLVFGKYGITFPLRDAKGNVVNFYAIRIKTKEEVHSLMNDEGVFPEYPHELTTRLFIATNMLDAVTMLEAKTLENRDAVLCIPNGEIKQQHQEAIERLQNLKTIIWLPGKKVKIADALNGRTMSKEYLEKIKDKTK